nr:MAG TPA: hypothetical protein [Caudoviricetes sp.]
MNSYLSKGVLTRGQQKNNQGRDAWLSFGYCSFFWRSYSCRAAEIPAVKTEACCSIVAGRVLEIKVELIASTHAA